jgi:hypothetical protein
LLPPVVPTVAAVVSTARVAAINDGVTRVGIVATISSIVASIRRVVAASVPIIAPTAAVGLGSSTRHYDGRAENGQNEE